MTHQHATNTKHDHCKHEHMAYCGECQAAYCKDCSREWSDCKMNHWPTYTPPVYIQPVQPIYPQWQRPYWTIMAGGSNGAMGMVKSASSNTGNY